MSNESMSRGVPLEVINSVLAKTRELSSPASEIQSVRYLGHATGGYEVWCFGMNDERLCFRVTDNEDEGEAGEMISTLTSGTIL